ncbi:MAG: hypothetical protein ACR2GY_11615 [Phycisphaerales bacterium]
MRNLIHSLMITVVMGFGAVVCVQPLAAQNCNGTSTGEIPINDLGKLRYLGLYGGGLYADGSNDPPADHAAVGLARAAAIEPLDANGDPDPNGKYVLISIGMSNTSSEFCCGPETFMGQAAVHPEVNRDELVIVNGAQGGRDAIAWRTPDAPTFDVVEQRLSNAGVTEAQVVAIWLKQANARPVVSLPDSKADAWQLYEHLGNIVRAAKVRYPNLQVVFLSSRIYAGYATTNLNPEPYAYESGFSVKWIIDAQIRQMRGGGIDPLAGNLDYSDGTAPWLVWGPYLWADGLVPRSDGLTWECADFRSDGTHPEEGGRRKVGNMLMDHFLGSPFTQPWFYVPKSGGREVAPLQSYTLALGTHFLGDLDDMRISDDQHLILQSQFGFLSSEPNVIDVRVLAETAIENAAAIDVRFEGRLNNPAGTTRVRLRNANNGRYEQVGSFAVDQEEMVHEVTGLDPDMYLDVKAGRIAASFRTVVVATFSTSGFRAGYDLIEIGVTRE